MSRVAASAPFNEQRKLKMDYQTASLGNMNQNGKFGEDIKTAETVLELTERALKILSDAALMANRLSMAVAGSYPESGEAGSPKPTPDGFVSRQEEAMRGVIDMASRIFSDCARAMSRLGA